MPASLKLSLFRAVRQRTIYCTIRHSDTQTCGKPPTCFGLFGSSSGGASGLFRPSRHCRFLRPSSHWRWPKMAETCRRLPQVCISLGLITEQLLCVCVCVCMCICVCIHIYIHTYTHTHTHTHTHRNCTVIRPNATELRSVASPAERRSQNRSAWRIKPVSVPLCPLQVQHGRAWDRIGAFAVSKRASIMYIRI